MPGQWFTRYGVLQDYWEESLSGPVLKCLANQPSINAETIYKCDLTQEQIRYLESAYTELKKEPWYKRNYSLIRELEEILFWHQIIGLLKNLPDHLNPAIIPPVPRSSRYQEHRGHIANIIHQLSFSKVYYTQYKQVQIIQREMRVVHDKLQSGISCDANEEYKPTSIWQVTSAYFSGLWQGLSHNTSLAWQSLFKSRQSAQAQANELETPLMPSNELPGRRQPQPDPMMDSAPSTKPAMPKPIPQSKPVESTAPTGPSMPKSIPQTAGAAAAKRSAARASAAQPPQTGNPRPATSRANVEIPPAFFPPEPEASKRSASNAQARPQAAAPQASATSKAYRGPSDLPDLPDLPEGPSYCPPPPVPPAFSGNGPSLPKETQKPQTSSQSAPKANPTAGAAQAPFMAATTNESSRFSTGNPPPNSLIRQFAILEIEKFESMTFQQATRQFRKLALQSHPDKNPSEQKDYYTEKFARISAAYDSIRIYFESLNPAAEL